MTSKPVITEKLRANMKLRYFRSRGYAAKVLELSNERIALSLGIPIGAVKSVNQGRTPKCVSSEQIEAIKTAIFCRQYHARQAALDTAVQISRDTGLSEEMVRNICNYVRPEDQEEAPKLFIKRGPAWSFLTAPAVSFGVCQGYY
jgi:hypothetical protein